jgi:hypothetical protein
MATINSENTSLVSQTGVGNFLGSNNPISTGACNLSGATSLEIPNSASPTLIKTGQVAIDTSVSGYPGILKYFDGTQEMCLLPISATQLASFANGQAITYVSANSRLEGVNLPVGTSGKMVQAVRAESTTNDSTTSTTYSNTSLSASIVPINSANRLKITFSGYASNLDNAVVDNLIGKYELRRTTGTPSQLCEMTFGAVLPSFSASSVAHSPMKIVTYETAGNILTHTYIVRFLISTASNVNQLKNATFTGSILIEEVTP